MIELSKLNGTHFLANPDLIRIVEATPDTVVTFTDGEKLIVREKPEEIIEKVIDFRRQYQLPKIVRG